LTSSNVLFGQDDTEPQTQEDLERRLKKLEKVMLVSPYESNAFWRTIQESREVSSSVIFGVTKSRAFF